MSKAPRLRKDGTPYKRPQRQKRYPVAIHTPEWIAGWEWLAQTRDERATAGIVDLDLVAAKREYAGDDPASEGAEEARYERLIVRQNAVRAALEAHGGTALKLIFPRDRHHGLVDAAAARVAKRVACGEALGTALQDEADTVLRDLQSADVDRHQAVIEAGRFGVAVARVVSGAAEGVDD